MANELTFKPLTQHFVVVYQRESSKNVRAGIALERWPPFPSCLHLSFKLPTCGVVITHLAINGTQSRRSCSLLVAAEPVTILSVYGPSADIVLTFLVHLCSTADHGSCGARGYKRPSLRSLNDSTAYTAGVPPPKTYISRTIATISSTQRIVNFKGASIGIPVDTHCVFSPQYSDAFGPRSRLQLAQVFKSISRVLAI